MTGPDDSRGDLERLIGAYLAPLDGEVAYQLPAKTAEDLEWRELIGVLADLCESDDGPRCAARLPQLLDETLVDRRLSQADEALQLVLEGETPSLRGLKPLLDTLERARRGGKLAGSVLRDVATACDIADDVAAFFADRAEDCPTLTPVAAKLASLTWLSNTLFDAVEDDGTLADDASRELRQLRQRVRKMQRDLQKRVERYVKTSEFEPFLQDDFYTFRDGRYVLPIKVTERVNVPGIVHGRSGSGQTVFIEPAELVDLNNRLMNAEIAVEEEEHKVFMRLSGMVAEVADALEANQRRLVYLDVVLATGRLAQQMDAVRPELSRDGAVDLLKARHPLLALRAGQSDERFEVIPNDLAVGGRDADATVGPTRGAEDAPDGAGEPAVERVTAAPLAATGLGKRVMVISGPNTGGKTVTLKTLGLCALMVRAGLLLPADEGSRFPIFEDVFTDVGDEQSIADNLSSFSAHVTHINRFLPKVGPGSLVLLDEIFSGTDPEQGAALAAALLDELADRGAVVLVTTHFEGLKRYALASSRFTNAAMGFDLSSLAPTYELRLGLPGSSYAIGIARRYGFPDSVVDRAEQLVSGEQQSRVESMLVELERHQTRLRRQQDELAKAQRAAVEAERRHQTELERLKDAALETVDARLKGLFDQIREAEVLLKRRRRQMAKAEDGKRPDPKALQDVGRELKRVRDGLRQSLDKRDRAKVREEREPLSESDLAPGQRVWLRPFRRAGRVIEVDRDRGQCFVQVGQLKVTVGLDEIFTTTEAEDLEREMDEKRRRTPMVPATPEPGEPSAGASAEASEEGGIPPQTSSNTLDLRGLRVHEALDAVDQFLDRAFQRREPGVYLIHGHGTGALKAAVRDHLRTSPYGSSFRPGRRGEGGDGVTVVTVA